MTGPAPDVRFSAGFADAGVQSQLRRLAQGIRSVSEEQRRAASTAGSWQKSFQGLAPLTGLIRTFAASFATIRLGGLVKDSLAAADAIGKLQQKVGGSAEGLSVLAHAATTADVSTEQLTTGLVKLNRSIEDLRAENDEAVKGFGLLNLTAKDLEGLRTDEVFVKVANAQAKLADGSKKTEAAVRLFGKAGAELIPLLNDLAGPGFEDAAKRAAELGLVFDDKAVAAATRANDAFTTLGNAVRGLAGDFAQGLAPAAAAGAEALTDVASKSDEADSALRRLGQGVGLVANAIIFILELTGTAVATGVASIDLAAEGLFDTLRKLFRGDFAGAGKRFSEIFANVKNAIAGNAAEIRDLARKLFTPETPPLQVRPGGGAGAGGGPPKPKPQDTDATRRRAAEAELNLEREQLETARVLNDQAFRQGLISLREFYDARLAIQQAAIAKEVALLEQQRDAAETPVERERFDAQLAAKGEEANRLTIENLNERRTAEQQLAEKQLGFETQVRQAKGETHALTIEQIRREADELDRVLRQQGIGDTDRQRQVQAFTDAKMAEARLQQLQGQIDLVFQQLETASAGIQVQVQEGLLTEEEGQRRVAELELARLPTLRALADEMLRFALTLGDPSLIAAAEALQVRLDGVKVSATNAARGADEFRESLAGAVQSGIGSFLGSTINQVTSLGDAFKQLALTVLQSIQQIVAQLIALRIVRTLFGGLAFNQGGPVGRTGLTTPGIAFAATGGWVPGSGDRDTVPAMLTPGEFVLSKRAVQAFGGAAALDALHRALRGGLRLSPLAIGGVRHYADGGPVTPPPGQATPAVAGGELSLRGEFALEPGLVLKHLKSDAGRRALFQIFQGQADAYRAVLEDR